MMVIFPLLYHKSKLKYYCSKLKGSSVKGYEIEANNISHYYVNYFCLMEKEGK